MPAAPIPERTAHQAGTVLSHLSLGEDRRSESFAPIHRLRCSVTASASSGLITRDESLASRWRVLTSSATASIAAS